MSLKLGNINLGSLVQGAVVPEGIQMLQGLAALPGYVNEAQSDAAQAQTQRLQMQDYRMKVAGNQWDQAVQMLQKNHALGSSPAFINHMTQLSSQTGYMLPKDSVGNIDPSVYGTTLADFVKDKDLAQRWFSSDSPGRHTLARMYNLVGITDDDYNAAPVRTAGEQVAFDKYGIDKEKADAYVKNSTLYTAARVGNLTALSGLDKARATQAYENGQAAIKRANGYVTDVNNKLQIAKLKSDTAIQVASIHASGPGNQLQYRSALHASEEAVRQSRELYNKLKEQYSTALTNGASPDDDEMKQLDTQITSAQKGIDAASTRLQDVQQMGPSLQQQAQSRSISTQSGKQATVQNTQNFTQGQMYVDGNGRKAIYLGNGQWQQLPP